MENKSCIVICCLISALVVVGCLSYCIILSNEFDQYKEACESEGWPPDGIFHNIPRQNQDIVGKIHENPSIIREIHTCLLLMDNRSFNRSFEKEDHRLYGLYPVSDEICSIANMTLRDMHYPAIYTDVYDKGFEIDAGKMYLTLPCSKLDEHDLDKIWNFTQAVGKSYGFESDIPLQFSYIRPEDTAWICGVEKTIISIP